MMARELIEIGGKHFATKAAAKTHARNLLQQWKDCGPIDGGDHNGDTHRFLTGLLLRHPDSIGKIGAGIDHFEVRKGPQSIHGGTSWCYWVIRTDGTCDDFSLHACIDAKPVVPEAPGIYVYSYPHYLRYPYAPELKRTLYKVGQSKNALSRFSHQQRETTMPERPVLLRFYPTEDPAWTERRFHEDLKRNGRWHNDGENGTEWFLTTLPNLDMIARHYGLEVQEPYSAA